MGFLSTQGQVTLKICKIRLKFEHVRDFMPVLEICNFEIVAFKTKQESSLKDSHIPAAETPSKDYRDRKFKAQTREFQL